MTRWACANCVKRRKYPSSSDSKAHPSGKIALRTIQEVDAVSVGVSDSDGILNLSIGEIVRLEFQRDDGWWYGTSSSSHQTGWFPSTSVDFLPSFKLDVSRCFRCFVSNPRYQKQLPGIATTLQKQSKGEDSETAYLGPFALKGNKSPKSVTTPLFPVQSAHATALVTTTKAAMTSLRPLSSPLKIKSFFSPFCQNLEILSLSPLLLKLEGFLDGPTCRSLISAAYQRGFSAEESGCHGDDEQCSHNLSVITNSDKQATNSIETIGSTNSTGDVTSNATSNASKESRINAERTSTACWLRKYDYETSQTTTEEPQMIAYEDRFAFVNTEKKISDLSDLPISHQEPLQIVRYFPGQRFVPHMDWIDEYTQESYGGRVMTVLIYLQAPKKGGSTSFPKLNKEVPPMMGTALFWYNCHPTSDVKNNVTVDERMSHAGEPVLAGEKIIAVTWVHPFDATELRER
jgi:hypothetical protein